jgi:hypothetical protein
VKPGREKGSILVELNNATPTDLIETLAARYDITVQGSLDGDGDTRLRGRWEGTIVEIVERALRSKSYILSDGLSADGAPRRIVLVATKRPGGQVGARPPSRIPSALPPPEREELEEKLEDETVTEEPVEENAEGPQPPNSGARGP